MGTVITWIDGATAAVPADDPRLAERERQRRLTLHVANMRRLNLEQRRAYIANIDRRDGADFGQAVRLAFSNDWEKRKCQA